MDSILADFHVHSVFSGRGPLRGYASQSRIADILRHAQKIGLSAIAITDHDQIDGSLRAYNIAHRFNMVAIPSVEISSRQGHILALNVTDPIPKGLDFRETIDRIHDQGGLAVCAHPLLPLLGVGRKRIPYFDGVECINGREGKVREELPGLGQFSTAGSDAHNLAEVGSAVTTFDSHFQNAEECIELLRNQQTGIRSLQKTRKMRDIVLPQVANILDYYSDCTFGQIAEPQ